MSTHLHILGICGTFMGGIAAIASAAGFRVTGCDANAYPPMSDQLRALGIELIEGFGVDQLRLRPDLWVVGNVITRGTPLMEAILDRGERYVSGPQWLAEQVLAGRHVLAVAGTHGKTTVASMLAWILERAALNPGFLIGGVPFDFPASARLTSSSLFVIEADEYDTAFFDKRSKFVHYRPKTAILNNLEWDHADIFSDLTAIERQFHHLVRIVPGSGLIVANGTDDALKRVLAQGCWTPVERFAEPGQWEVGREAEDGFEVIWQGRVEGRIRWSLLGAHNRLNALAAIAAARQAGVPPQQAIDALSRFSGVRRRLEIRGHERGVTVYDDFAHHPTAIRATLEGVRKKVGPAARILAVLEPRSNTMKRGVMKDALPGSLEVADRSYVYGAGLAWDAQAVFAPLGPRACCLRDLADLVHAVAAEARAGDHIVVMSNGGFGGVHDKLLAALARSPAA